ncbi:MAG TPA: glutathione S-transferase N-terminal domain-containing protein [Casimicrobiaceae bacterium]|nr:glutathione S-transferase N-terminal domain-containing protein [Casimicrobiaceae bacterium]
MITREDVKGRASVARARNGRRQSLGYNPALSSIVFWSFASVLKLIYSPTSPYARKVRVVLAEKRIEWHPVEMSPWAPGGEVANYNPLGKIPVLMLDDDTALYDSRVIVEYLDNVSPVARLIPEPVRQRIVVRRLEALADGICDAAVGIVLERRRPQAQQSLEHIERQQQKVSRALREMARELGERSWCNGEAYSLADIAAGVALGYLDFRHPNIDWRDQYPNLGKHAEKLGRRASFADTIPRE